MEKIQILKKACGILKNQGIVAIPTETVYGLAASIDSEAGLRKIFSTKERPFFDPLIVHVANIRDAKSLVTSWPVIADFLANRFWPGPLTLVLPKNDRVHSLITAGLNTVAIRIPRHPLTLELLEMAGPMAAPSANKFGKTSPTTAEHVRKNFPDIFILDGGQTKIGLESTVLQIQESPDQTILTILRPGGVTKENLETALVDAPVKCVLSTEESNPASPGHVEHHYMPDKPLFLFHCQNIDENLAQRTFKGENLRQQLRSTLHSLVREKRKDLEFTRGRELVLDADPAIAARLLYEQLHTFSSDTTCDFIYTLHLPTMEGTLWSAIWNRLEKAAQYKFNVLI